MRQHLGMITLLVDDYDVAIEYYTQVLGFSLVEDTLLDEHKRWVVIALPGTTETRLLLAQATTAAQRQAVGAQGGGRVFLFLHTDNFQRDFAAYRARHVAFTEAPRVEPYGTVAVFADLYGNLWGLIEPSPSP